MMKWTRHGIATALGAVALILAACGRGAAPQDDAFVANPALSAAVAKKSPGFWRFASTTGIEQIQGTPVGDKMSLVVKYVRATGAGTETWLVDGPPPGCCNFTFAAFTVRISANPGGGSKVEAMSKADVESASPADVANFIDTAIQKAISQSTDKELAQLKRDQTKDAWSAAPSSQDSIVEPEAKANEPTTSAPAPSGHVTGCTSVADCSK